VLEDGVVVVEQPVAALGQPGDPFGERRRSRAGRAPGAPTSCSSSVVLPVPFAPTTAIRSGPCSTVVLPRTVSSARRRPAGIAGSGRSTRTASSSLTAREATSTWSLARASAFPWPERSRPAVASAVFLLAWAMIAGIDSAERRPARALRAIVVSASMRCRRSARSS
jgi:hypothetical protein